MGIVRIIHRGFAMHVDYCPIRSREWKGKPYANVIDDCTGCTHCKAIETSYNDWVDCDLMEDDQGFIEELKTS